MVLSDEGLVKLSDYGLGENLDRLLSEKSTAWCMAPETFEGRRQEKSDVWSLGISLIELAEGVNPFEGCNPGEVWDRMYICTPPCLSVMKWSAPFVDFVNNCLVKDVGERWNVEQLMEVSSLCEEL